MSESKTLHRQKGGIFGVVDKLRGANGTDYLVWYRFEAVASRIVNEVAKEILSYKRRMELASSRSR